MRRRSSYQYTLPDGDAGVGDIQVTITADTYNNVFEYKPGVGTGGEGNNSRRPPWPRHWRPIRTCR